ncbi:MAG: hypothetical protein LIO96_01445 [Lachnospiraceae bacterium]|nr:hypothetical protein [Lachnospiraceae bacterium]
MGKNRFRKRLIKAVVGAMAVTLGMMAGYGKTDVMAAAGESAVTWKTVLQSIDNSNVYVYDGDNMDTTLNNRLVGKSGSLWGFIMNGKVDTGYTGVAGNLNGWWKVESGWVDFSESGVTQAGAVRYPLNTWSSAWYSFSNGKVQVGDNDTIIRNDNGWWYVIDGNVDFSYSGFGQNANGAWYVRNGSVSFSDYGIYTDAGNKLGYGAGERYLVIDSMVQEGMEYDVVRVSGSNNGTDAWWYVSNGRVIIGPTVAKNVNGWWYIDTEGKVDFTYNGAASNANGTWYISGGKVDFGYSGSAYGYTFVNGKAQ